VVPAAAAEVGTAEVISSVSGRAMRDVGVFSDAHPALAVPLSTIEDLARALRAAPEAGRRVTLVGAMRNIGTTMTAITLARSLAREAKVVLVDLAFGSPNLSVISAEPNAPGIADVVRGGASFGQIITRDKLSPLHLIAAGRLAQDAAAILASPRLATAIEALACAYAHVVIDAGAVPEIAVERFARLAPKAVLVAGGLEEAATEAARSRLIGAGFADVTVLLGTRREPETERLHAAAAVA
jgi:Mrp family chromosome partitioning ATPase